MERDYDDLEIVKIVTVNDLEKHEQMKIKCKQVDLKNEAEMLDIRRICENMIRKIGSDKNALGLSANQVGVSKRFFIMRRKSGKFDVAINPRIFSRKNPIEYNEGCLSYPVKDRSVKVKRHGRVQVKYYTVNGESRCEFLKNLEAVIYQHEFDHLNGVCKVGEEIVSDILFSIK